MASLQNTTSYVKFVRGTVTAWNQLRAASQVYDDTLYFIYESADATTGSLYLGTKLIGGTGSGGANSLADLTDVDVIVSEISNKDILIYNGTSWVNGTIEDIINLNTGTLEIDSTGAITIAGFTQAEVGTIPQKDSSGNITWVAPGNLSEITNINNQLQNIYNKEEVNNLIASVNHLSYKKVGSLEEVNKDATDASRYIYLVPTRNLSGNLYDEYMVIDNQLEPVGSWEVNLNNYITNDQLTAVLGNYITTDAFNTKVGEIETSINSLIEFKNGVGDLSILDTYEENKTLVEQVNYLTEKLTWKEITV